MSDAPPQTQQNFEQSLASLERLVRELEDGQLGLEEALARYEQGVGLIRLCHAQLSQAEQRILQLTGLSPDGQPILQAFQHSATATTASASTRIDVVRRPRKKPDAE